MGLKSTLKMAALLLCMVACEKPEPEKEQGGECVANVDPGDSVYMCDGEDLLWCVCDNYVDNECPDQKGHWVVQDILCTCDEWVAGDCPVE